PTGLTVQGGYVPPGSSQGVLTLSAAPSAQAPAEPWFLPIDGQAGVGKQRIRRRAEQTIVLNADPNVTSPILTFREMAVGLTGPDPFAVRGPAAIEVVKGYPTSVPIKVTWAPKQAAGAVELTGVMPALLPGQAAPAATTLTFKPGTVASGAGAGTF